MSDPPAIVAVAVAGGRSRRFGRDKRSARLPDGPKANWPSGSTLLDWTLERLRALELEVVVAAGDRLPLDPSLPRRVDDAPGVGPAAGILGAAAACPDRALLVLACDLPRIPVELLRQLVAIAPEADWVVPSVRGRLQPLCSRYAPRALERLQRRVTTGRPALHELAAEQGLRVEVVGDERLARWGDPERLFANLNRPEDLDALAAEVAG